MNCLTELPRQGEAITFKEVNNAIGFKKVGVTKNQFHTLENPKEKAELVGGIVMVCYFLPFGYS